MSSTFIQYLEENPKLFAIAKSDMCLNLIGMLIDNGMTIEQIRTQDFYSKFSKDDLDTLLELLTSIKLLYTQKTGSKTLYIATDNAKEFLNNYKNAKKEYSF